MNDVQCQLTFKIESIFYFTKEISVSLISIDTNNEVTNNMSKYRLRILFKYDHNEYRNSKEIPSKNHSRKYMC